MMSTFSFHARRLLAALAVVTLSGCQKLVPKVPGAEQRSAERHEAAAAMLRRACGSAETYDRLKALTFDEAMKLHRGDPHGLDRVAADATLRMESPVAKSHDEQLDITVCRGHLVIDLPAGVRDAFNGQTRLAADVEYSAQQAADGSGLVYQMRGAEPIIYRLAALTLPNGEGPRLASASHSPSASPVPPPPTPPPPTPPPPPPPPPPVPARTTSPPTRVRATPSPVPTRTTPVHVPVTRATTPAPLTTQRPSPRSVVVRVDRPAAGAPSTGTARPSFGCARVTSHVLRMVCADPSLAARDRAMSADYYAALANSDDETRDRLRETRDRFLRYRNGCDSPACIAQAYEERRAEIHDIATGE